MIHVVTGPPCSGKSTFVMKHAKDDEVIIDFDKLAQALGSKTPHDSTGNIRAITFEVRTAAISALLANGFDGWVIHSTPGDEQVERYKAHDARFHRIDPGLDECLRRMRLDGRPLRTEDEIRRWYADNGKGASSMAYKDFAATIKSADQGGGNGSIIAYASTFDREPDAVGDVVAKGAFVESIKEYEESGGFIPLMYGHGGRDNPDLIIGRVTKAAEDERGLRVEADFFGTKTAQDCRMLVQEGVLRKLSFAYNTRDEAEVTLEDGRKANELRRLDLFEVSLVPIPANRHAEVVTAKDAIAGNANRDAERLAEAISSMSDAVMSLTSTLNSLVGAAGDSEDDEGGGGDHQKANPGTGKEPDGGNARAKSLLAEIEQITKEQE